MESGLFALGLLGFIFVCYLAIKKDEDDTTRGKR